MNALARSLAWPAVFASLAFALLVGLGLWQLRRLDEKEALISRIETRAHVAPKDLPPRADWPSLSSDDYDYAHVRATGRFDLEREVLIFSEAPSGFGPEPGYFVVAPFLWDNGGVVLVDRGFVAASKAGGKARRRSPVGETTITGLMRKPQTRNAFTPADDPDRGVWYTRDPEKIAASLKLADAAPFTIALDASAEGGGAASDELPRPVPSGPTVVNNHLSYAVTWFGLAGALVAVFAAYAIGVSRRGGPPRRSS